MRWHNRVVFAILDDANTGHSHNTNGNVAPFVHQFGRPTSLAALGDQHSPAVVNSATAPRAAALSPGETAEAGWLGRSAGTGAPADKQPMSDHRGHVQGTSAAPSRLDGALPPVLEPATDTVAALRAAKKWSAGLVPYRINRQAEAEVLLGHMGGPFWKSKQRSWSILKGEPEPNQRPTDAFAIAVSHHSQHLQFHVLVHFVHHHLVCCFFLHCCADGFCILLWCPCCFVYRMHTDRHQLTV